VVRMTASIAAAMGMPLGLIGGLVAAAMVFCAVDLLRQPTWAWRAAGEPKIICLLLVLLLPGVGVAIYVLGARPKVVEIAARGRAASLPFERFADRLESTGDSGRAIQALSLPTTRGSFGEPIARPIRATQAPVSTLVATATVPDAGPNFFDDPDVIPISAAAGYVDRTAQAPVVAAVPSGDDAPDMFIPGQVGKPYNPKQRASLDEGPLRMPSAAVRAGDGGGTYANSGIPGGGPAGAPQPVPQPVGAGSVGARLAAAPAPRVGTPTPEIFRPRPEDVAPLSGPVAAPTGPRSAMAARWMNDPTGRHQYRYWDGGSWTESVYDAGVESRDAVRA